MSPCELALSRLETRFFGIETAWRGRVSIEVTRVR
jgi:hypothetical protein